ncbi:hypothetical protein ABB37_01513 [Leptomonas pyrrhocoris]|uniref:MsrB domain-containing protein n=1 Tax=Leptomonas pyrrhocoris TaxID=157538 RepID=A0A0M9G8X6_LEPPY|nr:hypothetical protein ABB37_01513 [Leptomonas pyrrhocoris]KPA85127.1 hypothetical protein ABB37_01513 [Leptomonas pyrrhocoris]|eukprot:XP_015663566.1 hypothetical protein ABB37_01513 [Leptomonas pyrrhocoris]
MLRRASPRLARIQPFFARRPFLGTATTTSPSFASYSSQARSFRFQMPSSATNCAQPNEENGTKDKPESEWRATLSPAEYHILREKGTDPVGGKYDDLYDEGEYVCAACKTPLYTSAMKFACGCGWPGFWDSIQKAVREQPDKDGRRVEIVCNACNSHLGHIFRHEGFSNPPPNERHCVNSTSILFIPAQGKN